MKRYYLKQVYSERNNILLDIYARIGKFKSSDDLNIMREEIYILPYLSFSFRTREIHLSLGWIVFVIHIGLYFSRKKNHEAEDLQEMAQKSIE